MNTRATKPRRFRCAIYTRKSSEEGLDQAFNSLDAQREACAAYVASQAGEGWTLLKDHYDDGGFSGGTLARPALQRLLEAVDRGALDIVVVYKVDRLTRSLSDFARIVERFEAKGVSFVSVTQAFNTTSSMGRLTLNVLLSFAQFEREVTGERIRDKIAASKAKGLWMGGLPSLGYDPKGRTLVVNAAEAETVRMIFRRYLDLSTVDALARDLAARGIRAKNWITAKGRPITGAPFTRGALYHLLRNRLYRGQIVHKGIVHPGQHPAIIDGDLFETVQAQLNAKIRARRERPVKPGGSPLTGLLFDSAAHKMSPAHARGKSGKAHRYYVSTALLTGRHAEAGAIARVPAPLIEELVHDRLARILGHINAGDWSLLRAPVDRIVLKGTSVEIRLRSWPDGPSLEALKERLPVGDQVRVDDETIGIVIPARLKLRGGAVRLIDPAGRPFGARQAADPILIQAVARAHAWRSQLKSGIAESVEALAVREGVTDAFIHRRLRLAFLGPDLARAILEGRQPAGLSLEAILGGQFPLDWGAQRRLFGFEREA